MNADPLRVDHGRLDPTGVEQPAGSPRDEAARHRAGTADGPFSTDPAPARRAAAEAAGPARAEHRPARRGLAVLIGLVVVAVGLVGFQVVWPSDRLVPGQAINGIDVGAMTTAEATAALEAAYAAHPIRVMTSGGEVLFSLSLVASGGSGAVTTAAQAVAEAVDFRRASRWVPGSFFRWTLSDLQAPIRPIVTGAMLANTGLSEPARDARIAVVDGALQVTPAESGWRLDEADLLAKLNAVSLSPSGPVDLVVETTPVEPEITTAVAVTLVRELNAALRDGLSLTLAQRSITLDAAAVFAVMDIERGEDGTLIPLVDPARLQAALADFTAGVDPVPEGVHDGLVIDWQATAAGLTAALTGLGGPVPVVGRVVNTGFPETAYATGFDGLRQELADRFGSSQYAVSVIDLTDRGRDFAVNDTEVFTAASAYKIYVAYAMINAVETGRATWNSPISGTTLATCFQRMIVISDNACPMAWNRAHGYDALTEQARAIGALSTSFYNGVMKTTAGDLATVLARLYRGELMNEENTALLIDTMKEQVYREGIPAGIGSGGQVADKVGFLDSLLHDAGIVFSDKGDYVLVVLTSGASWPLIACAASAVHIRM